MPTLDDVRAAGYTVELAFVGYTEDGVTVADVYRATKGDPDDPASGFVTTMVADEPEALAVLLGV